MKTYLILKIIGATLLTIWAVNIITTIVKLFEQM